ncbi:UDP-glucose/GDP-mannose dehydrogenase family protein [Bacillus spongiae]|uniref:UDP-glucose 6-dehydrogenase n=1 Tax=Bacillus spongiae TaxID=2683610 RepID=A0ABU8HDB6_9BACI
MNIGIIGAGYVGMTTSVAFAKYGHTVFVIDHDQDKINQLNQSILPFYEEGIENLLNELVKEGKLFFITNLEECIDQCDILFITVGTPSSKEGVANLSFVEAAAKEIASRIKTDQVIMMKSTVPVGTSRKIKEMIRKEVEKRTEDISFELVSNPEFLREGKALFDALYPERIVVGCETEKARRKMEELYKDFNSPILFTTLEDAEMIKYAANSFLATKISFMNELARLCDKVGANINQVAKGMGMDSRIGPQFLQAGIGFGGSCFPKDIKALLALANVEEAPLHILQAVSNVNQTQVNWFMEKMEQQLSGLSKKRIAILGLTFKPETDDIREASSLKVIDFLLRRNASIIAFDPKGIEHVKKIYPSIHYTSNPYEALKGAEAVLLVTEWKEIVEVDWESAKDIVAQPFIFDGRNALDPATMENLGYRYVGIGIGN